MSKIEELIQQYCPDGVEYVKLGEVCEVLTGGEAPENAIKSKEPVGDCVYPIFSNGVGENALWGYAPSYRIDKTSVTFSSIGTIGSPTIREGGYTPIIRLKVIYPKDESILSVYFLKYTLETVEFEQQKSSVPNINAGMVKAISIPLPPMPVQEEIVRILEKFSLLTAELEAELELRRKQYDFYRNQLLSFDSDSDTVQWKKLGEVAELIRGGNFQKKDFTEVGIPCIHYGQIYTHFGIHTTQTIKCVSKEIAVKSRIAKQNDIVMAITSENVEDVGKCVAWLGNEDIAVSGHTVIIHHNQNAKYLSYFFHTEHFAMQKKKMAHGTKVIEISPDALNKTIIPIPPLSEQQRIVDILDRFDALVNDLSAGLPAEIEARRKQYEYYRDTLLTFKRKAE